MAITHTEIYRRFDGQLRSRGLRFLPLCLAGIRVATRKKLPLLLFYAPVAISGIVFSFLVYTKFTLEADLESAQPGMGGVIAAAAGQMVQVHEQIVIASSVMRVFALLVIAWFGAGLIAEDKRMGAHLLYFSRPMTRLDYFLGHFSTVGFFGLLAVLAPGLLICLVATFSSPDYAFLKQEWDVILATVGYSLLYVVVLSTFVLAASSMVRRKAFALAGVFGFVVGTQAVGGVIAQLKRDKDFMMLGLWNNFQRVGDWMFGARQPIFDWDPKYSLIILGGFFALCLALCAFRIKRLEVVA